MRVYFIRGLAWLAVALLLLSSGTATLAQQGASTIRGVVHDPSGAVVPGAKVTITNLSTNLTRSQQTTAAGTFSFELIPVGTYRVEVEIQGFRKKVITPLESLVGKITEVKVDLEVGEVSSVVTVEGTSTAIQINTHDATLGNNVVGQQIIQLPMEARNVQALLTLQPGVTGSPNASGYVAGARSDQSNITLDGVDINEAQTNSLGSPVLRLSSEAVEEFRVTTVNANANQGRSSAAQVNLVTKSGTNNFHGSLFYFHRNTNWSANDFFSNRAGTPRPKLLRNVYGGTVGGPAIKDRLFFFYSYEGRKDSSDSTVTRVVPRPNLGQGIINLDVANCSSGCPTYRIQLTPADISAIYPALVVSGSAVNPAATSVLAAAATAYPFNDSSQGDGVNTGGFRFNAPTPLELNNNNAKVDWNMSNSMALSARVTAIYDVSQGVPNFPDTPTPNTWEHPWGLVVSHTWQMGPSWTNVFRYGFTRQAFSNQGDSSANSISFRFVFSPYLFSRTLSRTTPVNNFVNDLTKVWGSHTLGFGTNIRLISNGRNTFSGAYDSAITNPSFYAGGGTSLSTPMRTYVRTLLGEPNLVIVSNSSAQNAATALLGRYSQYSANWTFDSLSNGGVLLPVGTPTVRDFATQEYDLYFQDAWKITRNITLTYGLRYGISRPVYEKQGFEVKPDIALNEYLRLRGENAQNGVSFTQTLTLDLSGPANGRSSLYQWDKNNFQPKVAVAWSPNFENSFLKAMFGEGGKSVIRGGFGITNDYYGQALAVAFDLNNTVGFTSTTTIAANTYNVTTRPAPLFTGFNQDVRTLPNITTPGPVSFPRAQPPATVIGTNRRIESSLDEGITAPLNYVMNLTIERELPYNFVVSGSYIGRFGRKLLAQRDAMALVNLRDTNSGLDWYTAATELEKFRQANPLLDPTASAANTAQWLTLFNTAFPAGSPVDRYFRNIFGDPATLIPNYNSCCAFTSPPATLTAAQLVMWIPWDWGWGNDWTDTQDIMESTANRFMFFQPQYGALNSWATVGNSNYNGFALTVRQRHRGLLWDFNYTYSHSLDDGSALQSFGNYSSSGFIQNPFRQRDFYGHSTFDIRHMINVNAIYEMPFGRGKRFGSAANNVVNAIIGGWQLSGIFRWNTGLPVTFGPYDDVRWATNWNVQNGLFQTTRVSPCFTKGNATTSPKFFGCNTTEAYYSFRNAYPGETGPRTPFRLPGYVNLDMGLYKQFDVTEGIKFQLRWEVFNVSNTQRFGTIDGSRTGFGVTLDAAANGATPPPNWSNFTATQKPGGANSAGRVMQIGARIQF